MASFTTFLAETVPSESGGWFMRNTFLPLLSPPMLKSVIQDWLVQHDGCGVCVDVRTVREAWDSLIWESKTSEGKFI